MKTKGFGLVGLLLIMVAFMLSGCSATVTEFIKFDSENAAASLELGDDILTNWPLNSGTWHCATGLGNVGLPINTPTQLASILNGGDLNATILMADLLAQTTERDGSQILVYMGNADIVGNGFLEDRAGTWKDGQFMGYKLIDSAGASFVITDCRGPKLMLVGSPAPGQYEIKTRGTVYWDQTKYAKGCAIGYLLRGSADVLMAALEQIGGKAAQVVAKSGGSGGLLKLKMDQKQMKLDMKSGPKK